MAKFLFSIINYHSNEYTLDLIHQIKHLELNYRIIVLDNSEISSYRENLKIELNKINLNSLELIESNLNLGFARGHNLVIIENLNQDYDFLVILNNDIKILKWPEKIKNDIVTGALVYDRTQTKYLFQGAFFPKTLFGYHRSGKIDTRLKLLDTDYAEGSALIIPKNIITKKLEKDGEFFRENFFMYCEDLELGINLKKKGYKSKIDLNFQIIHYHSLSGGGAGNRLAYYYINRNRILVAREYLGFIFYIFYLFFAILSRLIIHIFQFCKLNNTIRFSVLSGIFDGVKGITGKWKYH